MQRVMAVVVTAALGVGVVACGSDDEPAKSAGAAQSSAKETRTIGVANFTLGAAYFIGMSKAVQVAASEHGRRQGARSPTPTATARS